jgi:hypothetical protein
MKKELFITMIKKGEIRDIATKKTECTAYSKNICPLPLCNRYDFKFILTCSWHTDMLTGVVSTWTHRPTAPSTTSSF